MNFNACSCGIRLIFEILCAALVFAQGVCAQGILDAKFVPPVFDLDDVKAALTADGGFSSVPFRVPNTKSIPEECSHIVSLPLKYMMDTLSINNNLYGDVPSIPVAVDVNNNDGRILFGAYVRGFPEGQQRNTPTFGQGHYVRRLSVDTILFKPDGFSRVGDLSFQLPPGDSTIVLDVPIDRRTFQLARMAAANGDFDGNMISVGVSPVRNNVIELPEWGREQDESKSCGFGSISFVPGRFDVDIDISTRFQNGERDATVSFISDHDKRNVTLRALIRRANGSSAEWQQLGEILTYPAKDGPSQEERDVSLSYFNGEFSRWSIRVEPYYYEDWYKKNGYVDGEAVEFYVFMREAVARQTPDLELLLNSFGDGAPCEIIVRSNLLPGVPDEVYVEDMLEGPTSADRRVELQPVDRNASQGENPPWTRVAVDPTGQPNFKKKSMDFMCTENGLQVRYLFGDPS